jgi:hypothetical protein
MECSLYRHLTTASTNLTPSCCWFSHIPHPLLVISLEPWFALLLCFYCSLNWTRVYTHLLFTHFHSVSSFCLKNWKRLSRTWDDNLWILNLKKMTIVLKLIHNATFQRNYNYLYFRLLFSKIAYGFRSVCLHSIRGYFDNLTDSYKTCTIFVVIWFPQMRCCMCRLPEPVLKL